MKLEDLLDLLADNGIREWVVQVPASLERRVVTENQEVPLDQVDQGAEQVQQNPDGSIVYPEPELSPEQQEALAEREALFQRSSQAPKDDFSEEERDGAAVRVYPDPEGVDHTGVTGESAEPVVPAGLPEGAHFSGDVLVIPEPEASSATLEEANGEETPPEGTPEPPAPESAPESGNGTEGQEEQPLSEAEALARQQAEQQGDQEEE